MPENRIRVFLDANVLIAALQGKDAAKRLFSPEVEQFAKYVVNPVVMQELLLASAATESVTAVATLATHLEIVGADVLTKPDVLAYVRQLRNHVAHTNDLLVLGSARNCDILLTYDRDLLRLGDLTEVATATPEEFIKGVWSRAVKAYLDSGVFIDYLVDRSHAGPYLRSAARRGRARAQFGVDAETCLEKLSKRHSALTSALTCYEVEEALYRELNRSARGVSNIKRYVIPAARVALTQTLVTIDIFKIDDVELTAGIVEAQWQNLPLQTRGVRAADALHVTTAILHNADLIISADTDMLSLDSLFLTAKGTNLRCVDTDQALTIL